jgi:glycosyltransferase involved in cell wall biosynthesis
MKRVLMVSPHFPPDTSAGTHRVRLLAPHLPAFGWEPTVLTVDPEAYEGRLDPDLARLVPATLRVLRTGAWPASVTRRIGLGDLGLRAWAGLRHAAKELLSRERFDALFITLYPTYPAVLGPRLKRRFGVPFVLDYQDPWVGAWGRDVGGGANGTPDLKSRMTRAIAERLEPRVVRQADALTAVSARTYEDVLARVPDARPRACASIPLGFEEQDLEALREAPRSNACFDPHDGLVHVCYVGTVLPTGGEVLSATLAAVRQLRDDAPSLYQRLRLHFLGSSNQRDSAALQPRVLPIAQELGVADVVREVPPRLDYLDALNVQVDASALLLLGSAEPHYTPSKVFPALLAGRPIVAVYHEESSVLDVLRAPGVNACVIAFGEASPPRACVGAIRDALANIIRGAPGCSRSEAGGPAGTGRQPLHGTLRPWSAHSLTGRLAGVLDVVAS